MIDLFIDTETYSPVNLRVRGVYPYVAHPEFAIIMFQYSWGVQQGGTKVVDMLNGEQVPADVIAALIDPNVRKHSHNVAFELNAIEAHYGIKLDLSQWRCTMIKAAMLGLPMKLDQLCDVLKVANAKDKNGMVYINTFCIPTKPTAKNGYRTRTYPHHEPQLWEQFKRYGALDVEAEKEIERKTAWFHVSDYEHKLWILDQQINRRGVMIDRQLCDAAVNIDRINQETLIGEAIALSGIQNPKSVTQLKNWLSEETKEKETTAEGDTSETEEKIDTKNPFDYKPFQVTEKLTKKDLPKLIERFPDERIRRMLEIRGETSRTSITKYTRMATVASEYDDRCRGLIQHYGANRTGRYAGRLSQPHNYPKNNLDEVEGAGALDMARRAVLTGNWSAVNRIAGSVSHYLSQLLRTAFVPKAGHRFIIADYSAIEARVLAWLAGEEWVLQAFRDGVDLYIAAASRMFKIPIESIGKKSTHRANGKVGVLSCGYQGAVGALIRMGALDKGMTVQDCLSIVMQYRAAHPAIVKFWYTLQDAATQVLTEGGSVNVYIPNSRGSKIVFKYERNTMFIILPSGRPLTYINAAYDRITNQIVYWGVNQTSKKWEKIYTYGGKLTENITQAVSRDLLAEGLISVDAAGYPIVLHIHDEIVTEVQHGVGSADELAALMCPAVSWAHGLPISAEAFESNYYKKDD